VKRQNICINFFFFFFYHSLLVVTFFRKIIFKIDWVINEVPYMIISFVFFFFFFFDMFTQEGEEGIRTNDLYFIRRDFSQLNYFSKTTSLLISTKKRMPCL
jgi:hypothetical protein